MIQDLTWLFAACGAAGIAYVVAHAMVGGGREHIMDTTRGTLCLMAIVTGVGGAIVCSILMTS